MSKISIIVPVYNAGKYLKECMDSILNQTLKDIDIICINDGSTDDSSEILNEYAKKDNRVQVIHKINEGLGKTYNRGIKMANGEYIAFVEPDDYLEPDMYEILYTKAKESNAEIVKSSYYQYDPNAKIKNKPDKQFCWMTQNKSAFNLKTNETLICFHSSIWSAIYKNEFVKQIHFAENPGAAYPDFSFSIEALIKAEKIIAVHKYLYHWRLSDSDLSSSCDDSKRVMIILNEIERAITILKANNCYEELKEIFYAHCMNPCMSFYKNIKISYKKEFFDKMCVLFECVKDFEDFEYKYFDKYTEKFMRNILAKDFKQSLIIMKIIKEYKIGKFVLAQSIKYRNYREIKLLNFPIFKQYVEADKKRSKIFGIKLPFITKKVN